MSIISVKTSKHYEVIVGENLLSNAGDYILKVKGNCKAAIISDSNVYPVYGESLIKSLRNVGFDTVSYVFPAGESSKNSETYLQILSFLARENITRSDMIIALGGGVVGDIAGFTAATFLRGIPYVQIPTSLLAMVDSSVGGKTAIDLPEGKNLVGAFKQPILVLCDISTLNSLPAAQFIDGCAEIIKYAMLYDRKLLVDLNDSGPAFDREKVISKCITWKRDVVQDDEFDTGNRQKLNFGHTIGHSIEACSNYAISHGQAVAAGMAIVTRAAVAFNYCDTTTLEALETCLKLFTLPVSTSFTADSLYLSSLSDKKRYGSTVNLIVPRKIGQCEIIPFPVENLQSFIEAGL